MVLLILFYRSAFARDLGVRGDIFEIKEPDLLYYIKNKLNQMQQDGSLQAIQDNWKEKYKHTLKNPKRVEGIFRAKEDKVFYYDPTYILEEDIVDHEGRIIHYAGYRVNSLDYVSMQHQLVFIDGSDQEQIEWIETLQLKPEDSKIILIDGSPFDLMEKFSRQIFFDQRGHLTKTLDIKAVPAIVSQSGKRLLIKEVKI